MVIWCKYIPSVSVLFIIIVIDIAIYCSIHNTHRLPTPVSTKQTSSTAFSTPDWRSVPPLSSLSGVPPELKRADSPVQYYGNVVSTSGSSRRGSREKSLMENKVRNVDINLAPRQGLSCFYCSQLAACSTQTLQTFLLSHPVLQSVEMLER